MKSIVQFLLPLCFFCFLVPVSAQEKGVTPIPSTVHRPSSTVRAVVIGSLLGKDWAFFRSLKP